MTHAGGTSHDPATAGAADRRPPMAWPAPCSRPIGLVDAWTEVPGPIGPLYVAWGASGVTAVGARRRPR